MGRKLHEKRKYAAAKGRIFFANKDRSTLANLLAKRESEELAVVEEEEVGGGLGVDSRCCRAQI
jgi:hypothetical protein